MTGGARREVRPGWTGLGAHLSAAGSLTSAGANRRTLCFSRGVHHPSEAASFVSRELLHREINMLAGRVAAVFISNKYFGRAARIGAEIAAAGAARAGRAFSLKSARPYAKNW